MTETYSVGVYSVVSTTDTAYFPLASPTVSKKFWWGFNLVWLAWFPKPTNELTSSYVSLKRQETRHGQGSRCKDPSTSSRMHPTLAPIGRDSNYICGVDVYIFLKKGSECLFCLYNLNLDTWNSKNPFLTCRCDLFFEYFVNAFPVFLLCNFLFSIYLILLCEII